MREGASVPTPVVIAPCDHTILAVVTRAGFLPGHFFCAAFNVNVQQAYTASVSRSRQVRANGHRTRQSDTLDMFGMLTPTR